MTPPEYNVRVVSYRKPTPETQLRCVIPPPMRLRRSGGGRVPKNKGLGGLSPPKPLFFDISPAPILGEG
jgi:hypothetical protein